MLAGKILGDKMLLIECVFEGLGELVLLTKGSLIGAHFT